MNEARLEQIVNAVLYEGYILYPYRPSSKKNRRERFTFGRVYPEAYSIAQKSAEPCLMQTECLVVTASETTALNISVRFLQAIAREIGVLEEPVVNWNGKEPFRLVPELRVGDALFQTWHEAAERRVAAPSLRLGRPDSQRLRVQFHYPSARSLEPIRDGASAVGVILRRQ
ncbi:MAG TPA: hypothetical protein VNT26_11410, partial [Candidatus Sulfotelmatobacter sp.]|nr:hypothetical protein [Candidatus Sulfotelmatobacter sp.]